MLSNKQLKFKILTVQNKKGETVNFFAWWCKRSVLITAEDEKEDYVIFFHFNSPFSASMRKFVQSLVLIPDGNKGYIEDYSAFPGYTENMQKFIDATNKQFNLFRELQWEFKLEEYLQMDEDNIYKKRLITNYKVIHAYSKPFKNLLG